MDNATTDHPVPKWPKLGICTRRSVGIQKREGVGAVGIIIRAWCKSDDWFIDGIGFCELVSELSFLVSPRDVQEGRWDEAFWDNLNKRR